MHLDLADKRVVWECKSHGSLKGKGTMHDEWFAVDEALAVKTVRKWVSFVGMQRPYDWRRKVGPFWRYMVLRRRRETIEADHDARRESWGFIISPPTILEYLSFTAHVLHTMLHFLLTTCLRIWPFATTFFWQIAATAYGVTGLVVLRSSVAATAFALVLGCACWSILLTMGSSKRKKV